MCPKLFSTFIFWSFMPDPIKYWPVFTWYLSCYLPYYQFNFTYPFMCIFVDDIAYCWLFFSVLYNEILSIFSNESGDTAGVSGDVNKSLECVTKTDSKFSNSVLEWMRPKSSSINGVTIRLNWTVGFLPHYVQMRTSWSAYCKFQCCFLNFFFLNILTVFAVWVMVLFNETPRRS